MNTVSKVHPLKYLADALSQIAATLRDFELNETAELLDRAQSDITHRLAQNTDKKNVHS
jgi:hypothetical protein